MSRAPRPTPGSDLAQYSRTAQHSSSRVLREYSTSFGMASRLLPARVRAEIESIYGLVRVADEVVDGAAAQAGLDVSAQRALLDQLELETISAIARGYSTNLVVHAFAVTARRTGIEPSLIPPFFASMRRDLSPVDFSDAELDAYIYGSAEVVGLMCLRAFLTEQAAPPEKDLALLKNGARKLGAAFQKINFLRDLSSDWVDLGRTYFPGIDPTQLTEKQKHQLVADIRADLDAAAAAIPLLPRNCRTAVAIAHGIFLELAKRVSRAPAAELLSTRIRVPAATKLAIVGRALLASPSMRTS